jgi:arylsulfatase
MDPIRIEPAPPPGVAASVRAGLGAGAVCGLLFGLLDGLVAAHLDAVHASIFVLAGCIAAAVLEYGAIAMAALAVLGVLLHPLVKKFTASRRQLVLLRAGIAGGAFAEIYWWSRPYVFYGRAALSPERLVATAVIAAVALAIGWFAASALVRGPQGAKRAAALLAALLWLGGAVFLLVQQGAGSARGAINPRNKDLPNVLLVVVDALRRDVLGCYGNLRVKTPNVDRLAAEGVVFENAFTQAPFTTSSFGSILTGKYPRRHGLVRMKPGVTMPPNETLPTILKSATRADGTALTDADWVAATFHTGALTAGSGLFVGFDLRYEATVGHDLVALDRPWSVFRSGLLVSVLRNKLSQHLDFGGTAAEAAKWIAAGDDRRFFAMVHLFSTHTPYDPPAGFRRMYCDPKYAGPVKAFRAEDRMTIAGGYKPTFADVDQIKNLYYGGVSEADAQIGKVLDALAQRGILDDTLVIVTADHGESLGEQNLWEHDHMVQTNLRIPLVLRWPKHLPARKRVAALVDEIDILPSVCDLLGISSPEVDGASFLPLVRGEATSLREYSMAENADYVSAQDGRFKVVVPHAALLGPEAWSKSIEGNAEGPRLYDLGSDPEEKFNLVRKESSVASRFFEKIQTWNLSLPIPADCLLESPRDVETQADAFRRFGYTEGKPSGDGPKH